MKKNLCILFGGRSPEHEISVISARNICRAISRDKYNLYLLGISKAGDWFFLDGDEIPSDLKSIDTRTSLNLAPTYLTIQNGRGVLICDSKKISTPVDICFPVLHGPYGEDGCIQGLLKAYNIPFVGCGVLGSALGMDKEVMKRLLVQSNIPTAPWMLIRDHSKNSVSYKDIVQNLGSPFFIKPANAGSSVGVHKIKSEDEFAKKIRDSLSYDHKVLAEKFVPGREIECSVMGLNDNPTASLPGEIIAQHEFYSYEAKYLDENGAKLVIPASLDAAVVEKIQQIAKKTFTCLECDGLSRIDFFLTDKNEIYVNEVNTIPGFTQISMYPKMWEATGVTYTNLLTQLLDLAEAKYKKDQSLKFTFIES